MKNSMHTFLAAFFALVSLSAEARPDYRCVVERVHGVLADNESVAAQQRKYYFGKEFTVDRASGTMSGALKNSYATRPQVIDIGSSENSYKVITTMRIEQGAGVGSAVYTLVVNEYVDAPKKPFVFLSDDVVYFGKCTHYQ